MGALLGLGLPTSATAAMMIAAFQQYGMQPGPLLFERSGDLVWPLLASLFLGLVILLVGTITVLSVLGVYAIGSRTVDLWMALGIGVVGFAMRHFSIPLAPVLIAAILGPMAETQLRRALAVSEGDPTILWASPLTVTLYVVLTAVVALSGVQHLRHRRAAAASTTPPISRRAKARAASRR